MSYQKEITDYLQREISDGKQYDNLFPNSSCKRSYVGSGDTFMTMDQIKDHIIKYQMQTAKYAAKHLKNLTPQAAVKKIKSFMYGNIQYEADGINQDIKSPQCVWASRQDGIDCKSYSVMAGCMLSNLGLKFYIRKIKQAVHAPDHFTHVYIVVPKDQTTGNLDNGYWTIDGTSHTDTESQFIDEPYDIFMSLPHYSLNGSARAQGSRALRGAIAPVSKVAIQGLENFLTLLSGINVSATIVAGIRTRITSYINQGIDPQFSIVNSGVIIEGELFPFAPAGRSQLGSPTAYIQNQLGISVGRSNSRFFGINSTQSTTGDPTADTVAVVAEELLDSNFFASTFGAIFANGFDLSCWNSSMSPSRANDTVKQDIPFLLKQSGIEASVNANTIRKLFYTLEVYKQGFVNIQSGFANCTEKGGVQGEKLVQAFIDFIVPSVNASLNAVGKSLQSKGTRTQGGDHRLKIASSWSGGNIVLKNRNFQILDFDIITNAGQIDTGNNPGLPSTVGTSLPSLPSNTNPISTGFQTGGFSTANPNVTQNTVQQASVSKVIGGVALAAVAYYLIEQNLKKNKTKKAA